MRQRKIRENRIKKNETGEIAEIISRSTHITFSWIKKMLERKLGEKIRYNTREES